VNFDGSYKYRYFLKSGWKVCINNLR
jgi:hypothetical protein